MSLHVHPRIASRHAGITDDDAVVAWQQYLLRASRADRDREVRIGYDEKGRLLELVGVRLRDGWLIFHAMTPPTKKTLKELEGARRYL